jgi:hypothetical protein
MTEFTTGIWTVLRRLVAHSSISRALIYTMGHIIIAMTVVSVMTGASLWEAGTVALIEPCHQWCLVLSAGSNVCVIQ